MSQFVRLLAGVVALALATVMTACSLREPLDASGATIVDVRTPGEYAAGHLQGAINIDIYAADFGALIAALPKDATYIVYCRSGVRSADAVAQMKAAGLSDVIDAGGYQNASKSTGLPIVTS